MIRVVLVDDETLVKVGLKSIADWEKLGFEIVAEGSNGEEGLSVRISVNIKSSCLIS